MPSQSLKLIALASALVPASAFLAVSLNTGGTVPVRRGAFEGGMRPLSRSGIIAPALRHSPSLRMATGPRPDPESPQGEAAQTGAGEVWIRGLDLDPEDQPVDAVALVSRTAFTDWPAAAESRALTSCCIIPELGRLCADGRRHCRVCQRRRGVRRASAHGACRLRADVSVLSIQCTVRFSAPSPSRSMNTRDSRMHYPPCTHCNCMRALPPANITLPANPPGDGRVGRRRR